VDAFWLIALDFTIDLEAPAQQRVQLHIVAGSVGFDMERASCPIRPMETREMFGSVLASALMKDSVHEYNPPNQDHFQKTKSILTGSNLQPLGGTGPSG